MYMMKYYFFMIEYICFSKVSVFQVCVDGDGVKGRVCVGVKYIIDNQQF